MDVKHTMKKLDTRICYTAARLECFDVIQDILFDKYKDQFDAELFTAGLATFVVPWTQDNFPILFDEMNQSGAHIIRARFFIMKPGAVLLPHIDYASKNSRYALNIPIKMAATNQPMKWFWYSGKYDTEEEFDGITVDQYGQEGTVADESLLTTRCSLQLLTPHYVNIGVFHSVSNFATTDRIILSLRFTDSFDV